MDNYFLQPHNETHTGPVLVQARGNKTKNVNYTLELYWNSSFSRAIPLSEITWNNFIYLSYSNIYPVRKGDDLTTFMCRVCIYIYMCVCVCAWVCVCVCISCTFMWKQRCNTQNFQFLYLGLLCPHDGQSWVETSSRLINIFMKICWLWLAIY